MNASQVSALPVPGRTKSKHIDVHVPPFSPHSVLDVAETKARIRALRGQQFSLLVLGTTTKIWLVNQMSSALIKLYAHTTHNADAVGLFVDQVHVVSRGVRLVEETATERVQELQQLIRDICMHIDEPVRVLAQCDATGQLWVGRRDWMDGNTVEPLFHHIYGSGSTRFA
jgi:hypothetical protein